MPRIFGVLTVLLWALGASAQTPVPIPLTGNLSQMLGSPQPYAGIKLGLQNCPSPVTIPGSSVIVQTSAQIQANASGVVNSTVWPNDLIDCNGTTGQSMYSEVAIVNGVPSGTVQCYQVVSTQGQWNLNSQQPIACTQTPPDPQDAQYRNLNVLNMLSVGTGCPSGAPLGSVCSNGVVLGAPIAGATYPGVTSNGVDSIGVIGGVNAASMVDAAAKVINPRERPFNAKGDCTTDDTAALVAAGNAVATAAASGPVTFLLPAGCYLANPLQGMQRYIGDPSELKFFSFPTQNNITVIGQSAMLQMLTPGIPYAKQVNVAAATTFQMNWFYFGGSYNRVIGVTFNNNGNAYGTSACTQTIGGSNYGCFWGNGIKFDGHNIRQVNITQSSLVPGLATFSWSVPIGAAPAVGDYVTISGSFNNFNADLNITRAKISAVTGTTSGTFTVPININATVVAAAETAIGVLNMPDGNSAINNTFLRLEGWPVAAFGESNMLIQGNYAQNGQGFGCANGSTLCNISNNVSVNARDAHYFLNGGNTPEQYVSNSIVSNNIANGNTNGSGVDVTAARDSTVSGNSISQNMNWCVLVDRSGGPYSVAQTQVIPSKNINVTGNTCTGNSIWDGWSLASEIQVGDEYAADASGLFAAGSTALNIHVSGNNITSVGKYGIGVGVGWGAKNVFIDNNVINGCHATACVTSSIMRVDIYSDNNQVSTVEISGNSSDATYTNYVRLNGTLDSLAMGINQGWQLSILGGSAIQYNPATSTLTGEYLLTDNSPSSTNYATPFQMFAPNIGTPANVHLLLGRSATPFNTTTFGFFENGGLGSNLNWACLGLHSAEFALCTDGLGSVFAHNSKIIPSTVVGYHGAAALRLQMSDGLGNPGDCVKFAADGSLTDAAAPCGTGTGNGTITGVTAGTGLTGGGTTGGVTLTLSTAVPLASGTPTVGHASCIKSAGPPITIGFCSTVVDSSGLCTCN